MMKKLFAATLGAFAIATFSPALAITDGDCIDGVCDGGDEVQGTLIGSGNFGYGSPVAKMMIRANCDESRAGLMVRVRTDTFVGLNPQYISCYKEIDENGEPMYIVEGCIEGTYIAFPSKPAVACFYIEDVKNGFSTFGGPMDYIDVSVYDANTGEMLMEKAGELYYGTLYFREDESQPIAY